MNVPSLDGYATVSIHAPARGATVAEVCAALSTPVSIHAPARGATRPRRRRQGRGRVSIHAPARGATVRVVASSATATFQFTRPRGARHAGGDNLGKSCGFNSRAREGRDPPGTTTSSDPQPVSIHAPARGATARTARSTFATPRFQFTRPRGARQDARRVVARHRRVSIHAPARGATRARGSCRTCVCCFNSRAREGRDPCRE